MPMIDSQNLLGFAKAVKTDTANTDAAVINIPCKNYIVREVYAYGASGNNGSATLSVRGGAGGNGTSVVADAALTTHTAANVVSARTVAATGLTPVVTDDLLYVRVGTASGVAGSTIDVAIVGFELP